MANYNDLGKQLLDTINNRAGEKAQQTTDLRSKYDYDKRVAAIDTLRKSAANTESMLSSLPTDVKQRTKGQLITGGQKSRILASETAPLATTLANISRGQDTEQQGLQLVNSIINGDLASSDSDFQNKIGELNTERGLQFQDNQRSLTQQGNLIAIDRQAAAQKAIELAKANALKDLYGTKEWGENVTDYGAGGKTYGNGNPVITGDSNLDQDIFDYRMSGGATKSAKAASDKANNEMNVAKTPVGMAVNGVSGLAGRVASNPLSIIGGLIPEASRGWLDAIRGFIK